MMTLLDLAKIDTILRHVSTREWAGPCPQCGGRDRFSITPDAGDDGAGLWYCRGCRAGGDTVEYLRKVRGLGYREACELLGRDPRKSAGRPRHPLQQGVSPSTVDARATTVPATVWQDRAAKLVARAEELLRGKAGDRARAYLAGRGIDAETLLRHHLGYIPSPLFPERAAWGLPEELREDGKPKKLFIPAGILIPCRDRLGRVVRVRVRREAVDDGPRYYTLPGSDSRALRAGEGATGLVLESDLDAFLVAALAGDLVRVVALGSAQARPDAGAAAFLNSSPLVLISLDTDPAGAAAAWKRWNVRNAVRWPIPSRYGKDPGDAYRAGLDIRAWVEAGLRYHGGAGAATSSPTNR